MGALGGYNSAKKEIITWLRQHSRPCLFSNSLAATIVNASIKAIELLEKSNVLHENLSANSSYFRENMEAASFKRGDADHAIIPVMIGGAEITNAMANRLFADGIYFIGFHFLVVTKGQARILT